ncbi:hypothetical protein IW261DRAFT_1562626 [Armillaria novae-zelandiae]|uniref:Uncharacterized protein n=1 Tax=Armillaria novae-zelandiae TaxID=153914 RepID=A0AA39PBU7_9AGAR|nr:hypothetical protein IW261DRAFT_1562626 [Armillaria novae-zelandiae]
MSNSKLIPSHRMPMSDVCDNLMSAWALTVRYFELDACMAASPEELLHVLNKAHTYLDVHMGILHDFKLIDSCYGLSLHTLICVLVGRIPFEQCPLAWGCWFLTEVEMDRNDYKLDESFSLPGEEGYEVNGDHSVLELDVRPFHCLVLPPPHRPVASLSMSASSPASIAPPETSVPLPLIPVGPTTNKWPRPTMIKTLEPPKDPIFSPISTWKVEVVRSPSVSPLPAPLASKHKRAQGSATQLLADDSGVKKSMRFMKSSAPIPSVKLSKPAITRRGTHTSTRKAKVAPAHEPLAVLAKIQMLAHSSGNVDLSDSGDEDSTLQDIVHNDSGQETEEIMAQPIKQVHLVSPAAVVPPPTHALRNLSAIVDNTIYACGFHPDINLQFHEPPSCEALKHMKMSLLPAAPDSLTKPPSQVCSGQEYVYCCHSDPNPYFIRAPLLNWPCFNCTLAGMPDECIFEGGVGKECCTHCKSNRHGPCSARWDANQLCSAATLLDPRTLSGDGSIFHGVRHVERLNEQLEHLGHLTNQLHADHDQVIAELADSLDAISACEHGKDIIDAYAGVSDFLKSFIIHPGESASQSPMRGSVATCLSDDGADEDRSFDEE